MTHPTRTGTPGAAHPDPSGTPGPTDTSDRPDITNTPGSNGTSGTPGSTDPLGAARDSATAVRFAGSPGDPGGGAGGGGVDALWSRLRMVEERVRHAVAARRAGDPDPDDPYRGQYLAPEAVERILEGSGGLDVPGYEPLPPPAGSVLGTLAERFGLTPLDTDLLLVALAPDLDPRFERLYGYLNDDLTRRRPTVGLALELCGLAAASAARFRLSPGAPLVAGGLVEVTEPDRPPLSRVLAVPDRVTAHLLGAAEPDARLTQVIGEAGEDPTAEAADVLRAAGAARSGTGLVHLLSRGGDADRKSVV